MTATVSNYAGVALRAYYIWEDEGRPHGRHEAHWFAAEAAETGAAETAVVVTAPAKKAAVAKAPAVKKAAAPKKPAAAKAAVPKAAAGAIVAAAALEAPRAARGTAKGARRAH